MCSLNSNKSMYDFFFYMGLVSISLWLMLANVAKSEISQSVSTINNSETLSLAEWKLMWLWLLLSVDDLSFIPTSWTDSGKMSFNESWTVLCSSGRRKEAQNININRYLGKGCRQRVGAVPARVRARLLNIQINKLQTGF